MKYNPCRLLAAVLAAATLSGPALAKTPQDPTSDSLNATAGPYSVSTETVSPFSARGFGGGTIYYPNTSARYGVVAICPGFTATQISIAWLARRMATHGLVVIAMDTITTLDQPDSRANQLIAALNYVVDSSSSAVRSRVNGKRRAVSGHSMGGGGALIAARDNPTLKGSVPLTPWNSSSDFSGVTVPTMIFGADGDTVAPVAIHARPFYDNLPGQTRKAYAELNNASHFTPNVTNTPIGRYSVTWMKRFVDNDSRYSPFLCGAEHKAYATAAIFDSYKQNCPY